MNQTQAYNFFENLLYKVSSSIGPYVKKNRLEEEIKTDEFGCKTLVTNIDKHLDKVALEVARKYGLLVISEEGENEMEILKSGNYFIDDSIDGTLAATHHVKTSEDKENPHINKNLGPEYNYSFLGAIVEQGKPRFGCCYDYVSGETIFLNAESKDNTLWEKSSKELYTAKNAHYSDNRANDEINKKLSAQADKTYRYSSLGKALILAQLCEHESAAISHFAQQNGLWDVATACVAAEFSGAKILDGFGRKIKFKDYLLIPGKGNILYRGNKFSWFGK